MYLTLEERRSLCETTGVTLDGLPATICNARNYEFGTVAQTPSGLALQWEWETIERIVEEQDGAFRS
jgi:hypothetical protein